MTAPVLAMTGATGFVGGATMRQAIAAGWHVRAVTRRPQPGREGVTWIAGALDDTGSLAEMATGSDVVMHIAGVVNVPTRAAFEAGNAWATANVIDAARTAGVTRFVHVSSLAAREPGLSNYGWSKERAEAAVKDSGLDWTIVRPPGVYGPWDRDYLEMFKLARRGVVPVPPPGRSSLIHVQDLAELLVAMLPGGEAVTHRTFEPDDGHAGGWSHRELARVIGWAVGRRPWVVHLPRPLLEQASRADSFVRRSRARLTRDRVGYMIHPDWVARVQSGAYRQWVQTQYGAPATA